MKTRKISLIFLGLIFMADCFAQSPMIASIAPNYFESNRNTIFEATKENDRFRILSKAIAICGLEDMLDGDQVYTLLAPANDKLQSFTSMTQGGISESDKVHLRQLLLNHIIKGKLTAARILNSLCTGKGSCVITTYGGAKLDVKFEGLDIVFSNESGQKAIIKKADILKSNGVIHELDGILGL